MLMGVGSHESGCSVLGAVRAWVSWGPPRWLVELAGTAEATAAATSFPCHHFPRSGCLGSRAEEDAYPLLRCCGFVAVEREVQGAVQYAGLQAVAPEQVNALLHHLGWYVWREAEGRDPLGMGIACLAVSCSACASLLPASLVWWHQAQGGSAAHPTARLQAFSLSTSPKIPWLWV